MKQDKNKEKSIYFSIVEASAFLNVHPNTIRKYIDKKYLTQYTLPEGKKILLLISEVKALMTPVVSDKKELLG